MTAWTFLYVISCKDGQGTAFSKIGISNDPEARLKNLQTATPLALELVVGIAVPSRQIAEWVEGAVHDFLQKDRVRGEWFRENPIKCGIAICITIETAYSVAGFSGSELYEFLERSGVAPTLEMLLDAL